MKKYGGGKADDYLALSSKTLKPYVDKNYKTKPTKAYAYHGSSAWWFEFFLWF
jgi:predicted alpha/beta superfamily hydrolase